MRLPAVDGGQERVLFYVVERCGRRSQALVDVDEAELVLVEVTPAGQSLYVPRDPDHPLHRALYAEYERSDPKALRGRIRSDLSREDFVDAVPQYLWKDPFGRFLQLTRWPRVDRCVRSR